MNSEHLPRHLAAHAALLAAISRGGSFSAAAEHLGIVQSAVSQRVKSLEMRLGGPLFIRTTRTLTKTLLGEIVCTAAEHSIDEWSAVCDRMREIQNPAAIRMSVASSLAMKWAIPSLQRVREEAGDILLRIGEDLANLSGQDAQVALRFGPGPYPGLHTDLLCRCDLIPVASPRLDISGGLEPLVAQGSSLLLHDRRGALDGTGVSWEAYAKGSGVAWPGESRGATYDRSDLAIQAAIAGLGIALGRTLLAEGDLAAGLLVVAGPKVSIKSKYWIVTTGYFAATKSYASLRDALRREARRSGKAEMSVTNPGRSR